MASSTVMMRHHYHSSRSWSTVALVSKDISRGIPKRTVLHPIVRRQYAGAHSTRTCIKQTMAGKPNDALCLQAIHPSNLSASLIVLNQTTRPSHLGLVERLCSAQPNTKHCSRRHYSTNTHFQHLDADRVLTFAKRERSSNTQYSNVSLDVFTQERRDQMISRLSKVRVPRSFFKKEGLRHASVLVPLCTVGGEPALLLTLRSANLSKHKGEVR